MNKRQLQKACVALAASSVMMATAAEASYRVRGSSGGFDPDPPTESFSAGFANWYAGGVYGNAGGAMGPNR